VRRILLELYIGFAMVSLPVWFLGLMFMLMWGIDTDIEKFMYLGAAILAIDTPFIFMILRSPTE